MPEPDFDQIAREIDRVVTEYARTTLDVPDPVPIIAAQLRQVWNAAHHDVPTCDLCGDQGPLLLRARCHLTAPLAVTLDGNTLILRCYVPECSREVARFEVQRGSLPTFDGLAR